MSSIFNDPNANVNTVASVSGQLDATGATVYDFEEGIRKHTKQIYGPVLSLLVQQVQTHELVEALERDKERDRKYFEDYKKEHQQKMSTWKM